LLPLEAKEYGLFYKNECQSSSYLKPAEYQDEINLPFIEKLREGFSVIFASENMNGEVAIT
jgi:hypothetical protein